MSPAEEFEMLQSHVMQIKQSIECKVILQAIDDPRSHDMYDWMLAVEDIISNTRSEGVLRNLSRRLLNIDVAICECNTKSLPMFINRAFWPEPTTP